NTDRLALISFATEAREVVPLQSVAQNKASLSGAVDNLKAAGNTALYDGVLLAAERLGDLKQTDRINVVLVMTDGIENASRRVRSSKDVTPLVNSLKQVETRTGVHVLVFAVAYGNDADLNVLRQLSEATRGQTYQGDPETIGKLYQLLSAFF
ncbi:MAG: VWA domain-containing protein, partial [Chloroflexota bacterium]